MGRSRCRPSRASTPSRWPPRWSRCRSRTSASTSAAGLLEPDRTPGGTRLYSRADVERLHRIRDLLADGLNLAGIARVLALEAEVRRLRAECERLRRALSAHMTDGCLGAARRRRRLALAFGAVARVPPTAGSAAPTQSAAQRRRGGARCRARPGAARRRRCRPATELGERATLLQFSSAFCAPCRATRRTLADVAAVGPGRRPRRGRRRAPPRRWSAGSGSCGRPTTLVLDAGGPRGRPRRGGAAQGAGARRAGAGLMSMMWIGVSQCETAIPAPTAPAPSVHRHVLDHADQSAAQWTTAACARRCVECPDGRVRTPSVALSSRLIDYRRRRAPCSTRHRISAVEPRPRPSQDRSIRCRRSTRAGPQFAAARHLRRARRCAAARPDTRRRSRCSPLQAALFAVGAGLGVQHTPHAWVFRTLVRPRLGAAGRARGRRAAAVRPGRRPGVRARRRWSASSPAPPPLGLVATGFALVAALLNAVFGFCLGCEMYLLISAPAVAVRAPRLSPEPEPDPNSNRKKDRT